MPPRHRSRSRNILSLPAGAFSLATLMFVASGCPRAPAPTPSGAPGTLPRRAPPTAAGPARAPAPAPLPPGAPPPAPGPAPAVEPKVLVVEEGKETWLDESKAIAAGYTVVDLSDDWTPILFVEHRGPSGEPLPNRYRRVFVGLANDRLDEDGQPLPPGARNYLELYGIPPSLSVLQKRFLDDAKLTCDQPPKPPPRRRGRKPPPPPKPLPPMAEAEKRLACEGFLLPTSKHRKGKLDDPMRRAIKAFQQRHMIYEGHALQPRTREAIGRSLLENNHRSLMRALRERMMDAGGVIEDGTAGRGVRNLADELTSAALQQLGLTTPELALAFFQRHQPGAFHRMYAGVKLPALPEYYDKEMELSIIIDRGDVWYDLPFDAAGAFKPHARKKYPQFMLFVKHGGKDVMLAKWRTTIGGWRAEQASDGYEYFRYKGSDVGKRVIRQVVAGPVWFAPASTPIRSLVKPGVVRGKREFVVNYEELGPGYLSAYGLVAGYFVTPGVNGRPDWDNGIRAHGSAEYLSMYSANGFSHGCHRLPNHLALRLYSFILHRRPMRILGDDPSNFSRQFLRGEDVFEIRIPSAGYKYMLDPPLPVEVLEGEIKGEVKKPIAEYIPKPNMQYPGPPPPPPNSPEARAGGAAAAAAGGAARGKGKRPAAAASEEEEEPTEADPAGEKP